MINGIHANAVAQQRAAGFAPGGIDRQHRDTQAVTTVEPKTADHLIGQGRLAGATGAGNTQHRCRGGLTRIQSRQGIGRQRTELDSGKQPRQTTVTATAVILQAQGKVPWDCGAGAFDHIVDHALQAELHTVLGRVDARHAIVLQVLDFRGNNHPAAAAEHRDMPGVVVPQHIHDVLEKFDVPPLVGADRNTLDIFLQGSLDDFGH